MAGGLYQRVTARGFPSSVADGLTGAGALESQGGPYSPLHGQDAAAAGQFTTLPGYSPDGVPPPAVVILEGTWGLPGAVAAPDATPRTHAAPVPGWAGSYAPSEDLDAMHANSAEIHAADFGALAPRMHSPASSAEPQLDIWRSNEAGESVQEPVRGQLQYMGGRDRVQGYSLSNRYGFDAGHRERLVATDPQPMAYLDPSERPFIVPQASGTFVPDDAVQGPGPYATYLDAGNISPDDPTAYEPPAAPGTLPGQLAASPASAGWWA